MESLSSARRRAELRSRGLPSIHDEDCKRQAADIPRDVVYNNLRAVAIKPATTPAPLVRGQADQWFDAKIRKAAGFKEYKVNEKRAYFQRLVDAGVTAAYDNGCVMYSRNKSDAKQLELQVVDAAVAAGLFLEHRSPKGSPKMSRLLPLAPVAVARPDDPDEHAPDAATYYVLLRDRKTKQPLSFDPNDPEATAVQQRLALLNAVNARCRITHDVYSEWADDFVGERRLRPVHYAVFTDSFNLHGRLYTRRYGHQRLRKLERSTICFNGEPSVEYDYGGLHTRLLYHLHDVDYRNDPYALWGPGTSAPQRLLAKTIINAAINAASPDHAIAACNRRSATLTNAGVPKRGKALEDARALQRAAKATGLTFQATYRLALKHHAAIKQHFCSDAGMRLMRIDGSLALDVCYYFANQCVPCLACHDSFIVPRHAGAELIETMNRFYLQRIGYLPVVK